MHPLRDSRAFTLLKASLVLVVFCACGPREPLGHGDRVTPHACADDAGRLCALD
ncbi:hypothetical protein ACLESD_15640 [Pyxidicoccus sp. 3LFB2]